MVCRPTSVLEYKFRECSFLLLGFDYKTAEYNLFKIGLVKNILNFNCSLASIVLICAHGRDIDCQLKIRALWDNECYSHSNAFSLAPIAV